MSLLLLLPRLCLLYLISGQAVSLCMSMDIGESVMCEVYIYVVVYIYGQVLPDAKQLYELQ